MTSGQARFLRWGGVFVVALLVRLVYWGEIRGTALDRWHELDQSDMHTYLEQAVRIAKGDWLGRDPFHPYHRWQHDTPEEQWLSWYPPRSFHQAPGYSYALALVRWLAPGDVGFVKIFQIVLGALSAVVLHETARRLAGSGAGWVAGIISAFYGPLIQIELQLLRDGPAAFVLGVVLFLMTRHWRSAKGAGLDRHGAARLAGMGAILGVLTLLHESGQVALVAALAVAGCSHGVGRLMPGAKRLQGLAAMACLLGGFAVAVSPWVARNVVVGAPAFSISSRSAVVFAMSNHATAERGGARWGVVGPDLPRVMERAKDSMLGVVGAVAESYAGRLGRIPINFWHKFQSVCATFEGPDNTSYAFYRERSFVLRHSAGWWLVFAPGLAGLVVLALRAREVGATGEEAFIRRADAVTFAFFAAAYLGALSLTHSIGRLRLCVVPVLIPLAGVFFAGLPMLLRSGRRRAAVAGCVALGAAGGLQFIAQTMLNPPEFRGGDFYVAAMLELRHGNLEQAAVEFERAIELGVENPAVCRALAEIQRRLGREEEALRWAGRASELEEP